MKITIAKSLVLASLCLISTVSAYGDDRAAQFGRSRDPNADYRYESRDRQAYRATEARLRVNATSRRDHAIAHNYINELAASRAVSPSGPPIDVSIRNGQVHLHGNIVSSEEHRALVRIAEHLRGVRDVQDELRGGGFSRY